MDSLDSHKMKIKSLKIEMKKWEKKFEKENGRKAQKEDIDKDETMKQTYIHYWKVVKNKVKLEKQIIKAKKKQSNDDDIWGDNCKKVAENLNSLSDLPVNKKPLSQLSIKLMKNSIHDSSKKIYSLNRKSKNKDGMSVSINANQVFLFKQQQVQENVNQIDIQLESDLISNDKNLKTSNLNKNEDDLLNFEINNIISTLDKDIQPVDSNLTNNLHQIINNQVNLPNIDPPCSFTDTDISFNEEISKQTTYNTNSYLNVSQEHGLEFAKLLPSLFGNLNSNHSENFNYTINYQNNSNQKKNSQLNLQLTFENIISQESELQYTTLISPQPSLCNASDNKYFVSNNFEQMDITSDFSPLKEDLKKISFVDHVKKLDFSDITQDKSQTNSQQNTFHCDSDELFANSDDEDIPATTFDGIKTNILFNIGKKNNEDDKKKINILNEIKQDVKKITKAKKKNIQKDANFRRLDIKKKVFVRGHKKFNTSKYKRKQWKNLQSTNDNCCFKCGEKDHWAQDCLNDVNLKDDIFDDEYDELDLEKIISNDILTQELFSGNDEELENELNLSLEELGFESFKSNQKEVIKRILNGKSVLMISSTGSGKSLCYQLPAYILKKKRKYITLVVSPLISLMEDQIFCLPKPLKGAYLHSGLTESLKQNQLQSIQNGEAQILYLSPEYILGHLPELGLLPTIGFVCIDEAHCLSEWSNNFRPSYLQLFKTLKEKLKIKTFLALTATSNRSTTYQIIKNIGITINDVIGQTTIPDNLMLTVSRDTNKDFALIDLLKSPRFSGLTSIIIYCNRRELTERLATLIRIEMQNYRGLNNNVSWEAKAYHAGLSYQTRKAIQKQFIMGQLRVVVATIAFGMGINKADVNAIIHFNLPKTFENYVQEIGRAGRNGERAECHVFLDQDGSDLYEQQKHIFSNGIDKLNARKLVAKLFKPCKCTKLKEIDSDDEGKQTDIKNVKRCPGHENAFSIKETTVELDIKEETLLTLLLFLELNCHTAKIKVLNHTNSHCKISCYRGGSEQLEKLAKANPFIGLPLAKYKRDRGKNETPTILEFSHVEIASMLGQESIAIRRKIKNLEWDFSNNRKTRTNIKTEFSDLSFHIISPGDLNEDEIQKVSQLLLNYSRSQEIMEISKLKTMYETFKELSQQKCINKINLSKSQKLKHVLNDYFNLSKKQPYDYDEIEHLEELASKQIELRQPNPADVAEARRNIRDFIHIHSDQYFTPRAIARILQGITSPKYPVETWGKDKRFWRKNLRLDFNLLMKIANEELVRFKC